MLDHFDQTSSPPLHVVVCPIVADFCAGTAGITVGILKEYTQVCMDALTQSGSVTEYLHDYDDDKILNCWKTVNASFEEAYATFVDVRQQLISDLRNLADKSVEVKRKCDWSTLAGSSVGVAAGLTALTGSLLFPPAVIPGIAVAGISSLSNLSVQAMEVHRFRQIVKKVEKMSVLDNNLVATVSSLYNKAISFKYDFDPYKRKKRQTFGENLDVDTADISVLGLQISSGTTKGVSALTTRAASFTVVEVGSKFLVGLMRGALCISVIVDGLTIYQSSTSLANESPSKLRNSLLDLADLKQSELALIMMTVQKSTFFYDPDAPNFDEAATK